MAHVNKVLLIILDGFGEGKVYPGNAIALAKIPTLTSLKQKYPWTLLKASGAAVGIPEGTQGGSEVGHFTIGAGRVVFQSLEAINRSIADESFLKKPALLETCKKIGSNGVLHLIGMISDCGVHSHINHLFALLELAKKQNVSRISIHAITDGRDVPERSAQKYIQQIQKKIAELGLQNKASIVTIVGRYYAMDRDSNWDRTQKAYDLYTRGIGVKEQNPLTAIQNAYIRGAATDYYIDPIVIASSNAAKQSNVITNNDAVIFWNFRTDRARQLTWAFTGEPNPQTGEPVGFTPQKVVRPYVVCIGPYSKKAHVIFPAPVVKNNFGEVISRSNLKQFRIAETEKYAHVTYFFNSQVETPFPGEDRLMIDSKKCPSYAEKPEMSAREITDALLPQLAAKTYTLIVLNFANCDLVGHSGNLPAAIKAVEVIDECLGRIIPVAQKNNYTMLITGDHGNIEYMIYEKNGKPCPSHTTNPVPFILVRGTGSKVQGRKFKIRHQVPSTQYPQLKDIAPTILEIMGIAKPAEMTGQSLICS